MPKFEIPLGEPWKLTNAPSGDPDRFSFVLSQEEEEFVFSVETEQEYSCWKKQISVCLEHVD